MFKTYWECPNCEEQVWSPFGIQAGSNCLRCRDDMYGRNAARKRREAAERQAAARQRKRNEEERRRRKASRERAAARQREKEAEERRTRERIEREEKKRKEAEAEAARYRQQMYQQQQEHQRRMQELERQRIEEQRKAERKRREDVCSATIADIKHQLENLRQSLETHKQQLLERNRELIRVQNILNPLEAQYEEEEKIMAETEFKQQKVSESTQKIVLLGITGNGKSCFGNRLLGNTSESGDGFFKVSGDVDSETTVIIESLYTHKFKNSKLIEVCVVDTPGVFDSANRDRVFANDLVKFLRGTGGVNAFALICKPPRLDSKFQEMLTRLEEMLGKLFWKHVVIVMTHISKHERKNFGKYCLNVQNKLREVLNLNNQQAPLPVLGIDNYDHYQESIEEFVTQLVPSNRFICDALRSPLELLEIKIVPFRQEYELCKNQVIQTQNSIQQVEQNIRNKSEELQREETKLQQIRNGNL